MFYQYWTIYNTLQPVSLHCLSHYTFLMPGIPFPHFKKTSILPSKPPSDTTSSRVNSFWSYCYTLHTFSLFHLPNLSYKANQCHTTSKRLSEGWVPGLPASRAMPFLLCFGVVVGEELCTLACQRQYICGAFIQNSFMSKNKTKHTQK